MFMLTGVPLLWYGRSTGDKQTQKRAAEEIRWVAETLVNQKFSDLVDPQLFGTTDIEPEASELTELRHTPKLVETGADPGSRHMLARTTLCLASLQGRRGDVPTPVVRRSSQHPGTLTADDPVRFEYRQDQATALVSTLSCAS